MSTRRAFCLLAVVLALAGFGGLDRARGEDWVQFSASLDKTEARPGETVTAQVVMEIKSGYHLTKSETRVTVDGVPGVRVGQVVAPQAKRQDMPALGGTSEFYEGRAIFTVPLQIEPGATPGETPIKVRIAYQGCSATACFLPSEKEIPLVLKVLPAEGAAKCCPTPTAAEAAPEPVQPAKSSRRILDVILAFFGGIALCFTPCVYPMIPITIGVIGAGAGKSRGRGFVLSVVYVLGIVTMFSILGLVAASSGGVFGTVASSPKFVAPLAALFVILGFGMMGAFDLQLPPAISDRLGGRKSAGVTGVFLMGFLAGVVASPCGTPVLAAILLDVARTGDKLYGVIRLFAMGWGLGLLFILVGTFSGVLSALPKSGGWMEVVKKTLGVVIIGASLHYAEVLLRPEAFAPVVVVMMLVAGVYVSSILREGLHAPKGLLVLGALTIAAGVFWAVGVGAPASDGEGDSMESASPIPWLRSEKEAWEKAAAEKRPMFIDFSAGWCTQCKRLDRETFCDPAVVEEAKRFVCLKLDFSKNTPEVEKQRDKYEAVTLPTVAWVGSDGKLRKDETIREFIPPDKFLEIMKRIR